MQSSTDDSTHRHRPSCPRQSWRSSAGRRAIGRAAAAQAAAARPGRRRGRPTVSPISRACGTASIRSSPPCSGRPACLATRRCQPTKCRRCSRKRPAEARERRSRHRRLRARMVRVQAPPAWHRAVADRRSAGRQNSGDDAVGETEERRDARQGVRFVRVHGSRRPLHLARHPRHHAADVLQQRQAHPADARLRHHRQRDDSRRADHSD